MYSLSSNSSYCPLSSPDLLQQSLSLSAHVVEAPFGRAQFNGFLVRNSDGSLDIVPNMPKSPAFVIGERILQPVVHKAASICCSIFTQIRAGFNRLDSAFGSAVALPQAEAVETTAEPIVKSTVSTVRRTQNCLSSDCPSIDKNKLHLREIATIESGFISYWSWAVGNANLEISQEGLRFRKGDWSWEAGNANFEISQEWLRFRQDDPREKLLYISADEDHNGAFAPKNVYTIMEPLHKAYDLKYRVVTSYAEICSEIRWAAKVGKLAGIIISAHGYTDSSGMVLSKGQNIDRSSDLSSCFKPLPLDKKIILISCYVGMAEGGNNPHDSFAQHFATKTQRVVMAGTDAVYPAWTGIRSIGNIDLTHPQSDHNIKKLGWFSSSNLFQEFVPEYPTCPDLDEGLVDAREHSAANVVDQIRFVRNFIRRHIKHITPVSSEGIDHLPSFEDAQDHLRLCKEDPKSKFLFLSSKQDPNGALDPTSMPILLSDISDRFDFKFKVIESESDICKEVSEAAKLGEIGAVLIHSHGNPDKLSLSSPSEFGWAEWAYDLIFRQNGQFPDCLSKIPLSGRIILLGGSTGSAQEGDPLNNLAYKVATITNRTVLAPTGPVYASKLTLTSSNPVEIYHSTSSSFLSSGKNSFVTFTPPEENDEL